MIETWQYYVTFEMLVLTFKFSDKGNFIVTANLDCVMFFFET